MEKKAVSDRSLDSGSREGESVAAFLLD